MVAMENSLLRGCDGSGGVWGRFCGDGVVIVAVVLCICAWIIFYRVKY